MPQLIVYDAQRDGSGTVLTLQVAYWLDAHANRIVPIANGKSVVPAAVPNRPATIDAQIAAGTIVEVTETWGPTVVAGLSVAAVETALVARMTALQTQVTAVALAGAKTIGAYYSGSAWTLPA